MKKFLNHGLNNEVTITGHPPIDPLGLSQLCKFSLGFLVIAYVISPPWVLLSRALKLCTCSVGPGTQKRKEKCLFASISVRNRSSLGTAQQGT